ncbi:MAG: DUF3575 domain-containing protein [Rikenellaceae bacterium]
MKGIVSINVLLKRAVQLIVVGFCLCNAHFALGQTFAVKSNLLYDATSTLNLGGELRCADNQTLSLSVNYNPWCFSDNKKMKHLLFQPEYRFWLSETAFSGWFVGAEAHYGAYNIGGMLPFVMNPTSEIANRRYQGELYGAGITYGYQWIISPRINFEASISTGYTHFDYDVFGQTVNAAFIEAAKYNYLGFTQVGLSIIYLIK